MPPIAADTVRTVRIGEDFIGRISNFNIYATNISISQRNVLAKILSTSNDVIISELERSASGVTVTSSNPASSISCDVGYLLMNNNCVIRDYSSDFISHYGASDLTDLQNTYFIDPSSVTYNINSNSLPCITNYFSTSSASYSFDNITGNITIQGNCFSDSQICQEEIAGPIGDASWSNCANMLIVDRSMLDSAVADNSYDFKPADSYTSHNNA